MNDRANVLNEALIPRSTTVPYKLEAVKQWILELPYLARLFAESINYPHLFVFLLRDNYRKLLTLGIDDLAVIVEIPKIIQRIVRMPEILEYACTNGLFGPVAILLTSKLPKLLLASHNGRMLIVKLHKLATSNNHVAIIRLLHLNFYPNHNHLIPVLHSYVIPDDYQLLLDWSVDKLDATIAASDPPSELLYFACEHGHFNMAVMLINSASVYRKADPQRAFQSVLRRGHIAIVKYFIRVGGAKLRRAEWEALMTTENHLDCVKFMFDYIAEYHPDVEWGHGRPLPIAISRGHAKIVKLFLQYGFAMDLTYLINDAILSDADLNVIRILLDEAKFDQETLDNLFIRAIEEDNPSNPNMIRFLLSYGAHPTSTDLEIAYRLGPLESVMVLSSVVKCDDEVIFTSVEEGNDDEILKYVIQTRRNDGTLDIFFRRALRLSRSFTNRIFTVLMDDNVLFREFVNYIVRNTLLDNLTITDQLVANRIFTIILEDVNVETLEVVVGWAVESNLLGNLLEVAHKYASKSTMEAILEMSRR